MADVVWEDPPQAAVGTYCKHSPIADKLRTRKGEWGRVAVCATATKARVMASSIRRGVSKAYEPRGDFDATHRFVDGEYRVYARYLGDDGDD